MIFLVPSFHYDNTWHDTSKNYYGFVNECIIKVALDILRKNRNFKFTFDHFASLEDFLRKYPAKRRVIKEMLKQKRIEIAGRMYIMMDCVIPDGEYFLRQMLYGGKWMRSKLGVEPINYEWLVDVYGYCGQLPQILKKCGVDNLVLSLWWAEKWYVDKVSRFLDFIWEGIDGSRLIVHNCPDYGAVKTPGRTGCPHCHKQYYPDLKSIGSSWEEVRSEIEREYNRIKGKTAGDVFFVEFGGDFRVHHENIVKYVNMWNNNYKLKIKFATPSEYFERIKKDNLPIRKGEINPLYPGRFGEGYRETKVRIKQLTMNFINVATQAETLSTFAFIYGKKYERKKFEDLYKPFLFYQHHDPFIGNIPYQEYKILIKSFERSIESSTEIRDRSAKFLLSRLGLKNFIFNSLSWWRGGIVGSGDKLFFIDKVPPLGYKVISDGCVQVLSGGRGVKFVNLKTKFYKLEIRDGRLCLFDKELKKNFKINEIFIEEDIGCFCWIIKTGRVWNEKQKEAFLVEDGPLRWKVVISSKVRGIDIVKEIYLYSFSRRIDFCTKFFLENGENSRIRVNFTLPFKSEKIFAEIPFGYVKREHPVKGSLLFPILRWVDYRSKIFGFALFTQGLHSVETNGRSLILTLVKGLSTKNVKEKGHCACLPSDLRGEMVERGDFEFRYAILPHKNLEIYKIVREGYDFNIPLLFFERRRFSSGYGEGGFISILPDNLIITLLKKSEEDNSIVLRVYEAQGKKTDAEIFINLGEIKSCHETDLLERKIKEVKVKRNKIKVNFNGYDIKTFSICLK